MLLDRRGWCFCFERWRECGVDVWSLMSFYWWWIWLFLFIECCFIRLGWCCSWVWCFRSSWFCLCDVSRGDSLLWLLVVWLLWSWVGVDWEWSEFLFVRWWRWWLGCRLWWCYDRCVVVFLKRMCLILVFSCVWLLLCLLVGLVF